MNVELENLNVEKQVEFITLNVSNNSFETTLNTVVKNVISANEYYDGTYEVTPYANEKTVLQTKEKTMKDNVTVNQIPDYRVDNDYGQTVTIGKEI